MSRTSFSKASKAAYQIKKPNKHTTVVTLTGGGDAKILDVSCNSIIQTEYPDPDKLIPVILTYEAQKQTLNLSRAQAKTFQVTDGKRGATFGVRNHQTHKAVSRNLSLSRDDFALVLAIIRKNKGKDLTISRRTLEEARNPVQKKAKARNDVHAGM